MTKELITWYGDNQHYFLWSIIAVQTLILFAINFKSKKSFVNVPVGFIQTLIKGDPMLVYKLSVGAAVDSDVVKRVLTVEVNDSLVETKEFPSTATDLGELSFNQDDNVNLALVDVDDAGNVSEPAFLRFVAVDTLPPAAPGAFGAALVRETSDNPAPVVPPPVPEPEPTPISGVTPEDEARYG